MWEIIASFAAIVAATIAAEAIRAQIISDKRQKWIDDLRDDIAELMAITYDPDKNKRKIYEVGSRIELRLNPREDMHNTLLRLLQDMRVIHPATKADYDEKVNEILNSTKPILKEEWERIKSESSPFFRIKKWRPYSKS